MTKPKDPNCTQSICSCYFVALLVIIVYGIYRIFFGKNVILEEYINAGAVLLTWIGIAFYIPILGWTTDGKQNTDEVVSKCQNSLLILLGIGIFFAFLPRFVVFFISTDSMVFWYTVNISLFVITLIGGCTEIVQQETQRKISRKWSDCHSWLILFLHLALLVFTFWIGDRRRYSIPTCQFCYFFICASLNIDIWYVWRGKVQNMQNMDVRATVDVENPVAQNKLRIECKICMSPFNDGCRVPKMLACGHTVCQSCSKKLARNNMESNLTCPFCQEVTQLKDGRLPKNFILMDVIDEGYKMETGL